MTTKQNSILTIGAILTMAVVLFAFTSAQDAWQVPANYKSMQNKFKGADKDGVGEDLYAQHCRSCHGKTGLGDGTKSRELKTKIRSLASSDVQGQTDGELYYKAFIGRDEMPNFEKKIADVADRWAVVGYIRTLKK